MLESWILISCAFCDFTPVKFHVICQQRSSRFSYIHLLFVVLRTSLFRRCVYLSSTHTINLCYITNIIIKLIFPSGHRPRFVNCCKNGILPAKTFPASS
jgi:hypothetical protein